MSSEIINSEYDDTYSDFILAPPLNYSDWNGYEITWRDLPGTRSEVEQRILEIDDSSNHILANQLATIYFLQMNPRTEVKLVKAAKTGIYDSEENFKEWIECAKEVHARRIAEGKQAAFEVGLVDEAPPPELLAPISETNYPALWARQVYYLENGISLSPEKLQSGGFKEFWEKHKKAIIISAVVIVIAVTVTVVIVTTAGTGTSVVVASGAAAAEAAQAAINDYNSSEDSNSNVKDLQHQFHVEEGVQNFATTIGGTVNETSGPISIIEADSISEVTSDVLTGLVTDWNKSLDPAIEATNELLLEEMVLQEDANTPTRKESIIDLARKAGSVISHETVIAADQILSVVPEFLEEVRAVGERWGLDRFIGSSYLDPFAPQENYDDSFEYVHEKIDDIFNTQIASSYAPDTPEQDFTVGYIPFPGTGKIPVTQANNVWGWRLGDQIQNRTIFGRIPKWSTVRARFWKNESYSKAHMYKPPELERMRKGLAPQRLNPTTGQIESMELHHIPPQREGGLFDFIKVWPSEHAELDSCRYIKK